MQVNISQIRKAIRLLQPTMKQNIKRASPSFSKQLQVHDLEPFPINWSKIGKDLRNSKESGY